MKKILFLFSLFFIISSFNVYKHPFHVGSVEFNYNTKSQKFEISGKFFIDDLENGINKSTGKNLRFQDVKMKSAMDEAVKNYFKGNLKLKVNNQVLGLNYIGFEEDSESVNVFLESEKIVAPKKIETAVSILYNIFDDQMNIIHIIVNGKRESEKLNYPNQYLKKSY
jgi:hypothetical protein